MSINILQDIIFEFDVNKFIRFFRSKNRSFSPHQESFDQYDDESFSNCMKLGEVLFSKEAQKLIFFAFKSIKPLSEREGKKNQYEKGKKILKYFQSDVGIFIFYDTDGNFRLSLVYTNYIGGRRDWSTFRRFTYYVSPNLTNKTFLQRIGESDFSSLDKIKDAFSVEKVTSKFFKEFREYFEKTKKEFEKSNKNTVCPWLKSRYSGEEYKEQVNKFTYNLLGRIIFIYFLQRKGWIENDNNYLRKYVQNENNFKLYLNFFRPLFFEIFAKKEKDRAENIKNQYKNTPYLNGGLFDKSNLEIQLEKENIFILFDDAFIRELILNFFEIYNFTIDENSPNDQEVSIDPEMLGKVFENTLAEEERGKKGTFYTPREIVHYMVKKSLLIFLQNETKIEENKLFKLIFYDENDTLDLEKEEIRLIDYKLENIKVFDPAVGSGAFPVEMMQILVNLRKKLNVNVGKNISEVSLKKRFIKENIYGVDIDPGAIEIAKLRLWLSLIVDYEKSETELLPNLDFQFRLGNSLQEKIGKIDIFQESNKNELQLSWVDDFEVTKQQMLRIKDEYYLPGSEEKKKQLKKKFDTLEHQIILHHVKILEKRWENEARFGRITGKDAIKLDKEINSIKQKIKDGTYKLFKPDFHFSEVFDRKNKDGDKIGGFDIVISNPPYGVKVDDDIKKWHKLGNKDSYGVFISTALKRFLKPRGVLSFIVSDTWLTIKTHKQLRKQVLEKQLHNIIRVHQDCFNATVNACIINLTNQINNNSYIIAADLTNISTRDEIEELRQKLYNLKKYIGKYTPKYAIYQYKQTLIKTSPNMPIFVCSPKLFCLISSSISNKKIVDIKGKKIVIKQIKYNGKTIAFVRFGDIAEVRKGIDTGCNKDFLFQNPEARGSYRSIEEYQKYLLTEKDLKKIVDDNNLRLKIIKKGFHKTRTEKDFDEDLWMGGRYIIPYDKGGESDTDSGWLPNYYVPTSYYIDWSRGALRELKKRTYRKSGNHKATIRNEGYWFKKGITFSLTGQYSPTIRINSFALFDNGGSSIFPFYDNKLNKYLSILASKTGKYLFRNYLDHTVNAQVDEFKEMPIFIKTNNKIVNLVNEIIQKQKENPRYDYVNNEQKEIDKLVYEMYGLNDDDIREIETWYARRYPKLARFCNIN